MEIQNFNMQPLGSKIIAEFDVYIPALKATFHRLRVVRKHKGGFFIAFPSFSKEGQGGAKSWHPYISFGEERALEFDAKCSQLLKPFLDGV